MDFTPELTTLQGVILSADNLNSFSNLTARGGNESEIEEVVKCIKNFLVKEKYANDNSLLENSIATVRKFAFYVVLNADLPILQRMVEKDGIDFLIWTIPTVPKCLMCEMMWKLHMDKFVNEIIAFCCPEFSVEVAESFTNHMKYINPKESAEKVYLIAAACYKQICRLNFFNVNENLLNTMFSIFQKSLKYFSSPPNFRKLEGLSQNQLYKFIGESLYKLLILLYECFEEYYCTQKFKLGEGRNIYMLTYNEENVFNKDDVKTNESRKEILQYLHKCHEALLDILKELVMGVSVDIYCTWCEFEDKGQTMQQIIGELCYKLHSRLMNIKDVADHPVVEMLHQISCKPVEIKDIINTTTSADIIENIKNKLDKHLWIQALLEKNNLCEDLLLIDNLMSNLELLRDDDFPRLYNICIEYIDNSVENKEAVKLLAIKAFQLCDIPTKLDIIDHTFARNCFTDEKETTEFNNMMTEIFNKLIACPDADLSNILTIFIQNPKKTYKKIFSLAAENAQQSVIMGRIMKYLEKYSNYYYSDHTEACVIRTLQDVIACELNSETSQKNFINFICLLKDNDIISGAKLLLLIIMPNLHLAMLQKKVIKIQIYIKMLSKVYTIKELLDYRAPMLAMIAQVLDVVRWKIDSFNALRSCCLELAIELQTSIINTYESNISEKESAWLKTKLKKNNPLNMYYYRVLWNPSGNTYLEILTGIHVHEGLDIEQLTLSISQIICSTVLNEWHKLWDSLSPLHDTTKLNVFLNALVLVSIAEKDNRTESTWACLLHCYSNFFQMTRYKYISEPVTDNHVVTVINKIAMLVNLLEDEDIEEFQSVSLPLLGYIAERKSDYTINVNSCISDSIKNPMYASLLQNIFTTTHTG